MCEIVEISARRKTRVEKPVRRLGRMATTFVLIPNERLSRLREFWTDLKAYVEAEDDTPKQLIRS